MTVTTNRLFGMTRLLNGADKAITVYGIGLVGSAELNPLMNFGIRLFGTSYSPFTSVVLAGGLLWFASDQYFLWTKRRSENTSHQKAYSYLGWYFVMVLSLVVGWNLIVVTNGGLLW